MPCSSPGSPPGRIQPAIQNSKTQAVHRAAELNRVTVHIYLQDCVPKSPFCQALPAARRDTCPCRIAAHLHVSLQVGLISMILRNFSCVLIACWVLRTGTAMLVLRKMCLEEWIPAQQVRCVPYSLHANALGCGMQL